MDVDPTKSSVKYHYEEKCKLIKVVKLSKLKKEKGDLIDTPTKASLLFNPEAKSYHILIQSASTHTSLFSGLILPKKSEFKIMNKKVENLEIRCFNLNKQSKKLESQIIKIQIVNEGENDSQEFLDTLKQIIEGSYEWTAEKEEKSE